MANEKKNSKNPLMTKGTGKELYTGVKGQGLAIWVPSDVKKQVELLCAKAKTNIPIRSMAAAMIMAFIEEHRRELNNL